MGADPLSEGIVPAAGLDSAAGSVTRERAVRRSHVLRMLRRSPTFVVGSALLLFWVLMALVGQYVTPIDPFEIDPYNTLSPPSTTHWFGTDDLGRDVFARTMAGARPVLIIAPLATLLSLAGGAAVALVAGYYRGVVDEVSMRIVDVFLSLPVVIAAIFVLSLLGSSIPVVILVIALLFIPVVSRTIRAAVLGERDREYVQAARLRGERPSYIMAAEILPNALSPIIVEGTVRLGYAVFTAATISFLGFGLQPPSPDWGLTIAQERAFIQVAWWTVVFPALALASLVVAANLVADGLRRAFQG
jgi:peptide/nickel transport system permease protein